MFDKPVSDYLKFQRLFLFLVAAVGLARLVLSLAGLPDGAVTWLSMNVVFFAAVLYYGIAVHTRRFGSYRHLLPLIFFQILVQQIIAVAGILLAIAGLQNIYAAPEYSFGAQTQWIHALSHLTIGIVVPSLLFWGVASLILLITKKVGQPATA